MKKSMLTLGLVAACALALTGCVKEIEPCTPAAEAAVSEGVPFELVVGFDATKTNTANNLKVAWEEGDAINVFHAVAGTKDYINDGKFTVKEAGFKGVFAGELAQALNAEKSYDWLIAYPYNEETTSPDAFTWKMDRSNPCPGSGEVGNLNVLKLPLWSNTKALDGKYTPKFIMHQAFALVKLSLTNVNLYDTPLVNFSISTEGNLYPTTATDLTMTGDATIDLTADKPTATRADGYNPKHSTLYYGGQDLTFAKGETRTQYLPVFPKSYPAGTVFEFRANGNGACAKRITTSEIVEFKAGKVTEINVDLDKDLYLTEEEAMNPILFRLVYKDDQLSAESWKKAAIKNNPPKFFSVIDHNCIIYDYYAKQDEVIRHGKAYFSTDGINSVDIKGEMSTSASASRYYLPTISVAQNESLTVNANFEKLPAGKKVVFYTSLFVNKISGSENYKVTYSINGSAPVDATITLPNGSGDSAEGGNLKLPFTENFSCHPMIISTGIIPSDIEKAKLVFKVTSLDADKKGQIGFAPYYTYNPSEGFRRCEKGPGKDKNGDKFTNWTGAWDYIETATGNSNNDGFENWGAIDDITACAYLKVE